MNKFLLICMLFIGCSFGAFAQETVEITGVVTDPSKEPLPGVNVYVSELPGLGTITDTDGRYKIIMPAFQRLTFSFIGFDNVVVQIKDQRVVNVVMEYSESSILDEVVITGTGAQKGVSNRCNYYH